jgi:hypothetical protein
MTGRWRTGRLAEVAQNAGLKHQTVAQALKRFRQALAEDPARKRFVSKLKLEMPTITICYLDVTPDPD